MAVKNFASSFSGLVSSKRRKQIPLLAYGVIESVSFHITSFQSPTHQTGTFSELSHVRIENAFRSFTHLPISKYLKQSFLHQLQTSSF